MPGSTTDQKVGWILTSHFKEQWLERNDFEAILHLNFGSYVPIHNKVSPEQEKRYLCLAVKCDARTYMHIQCVQCHIGCQSGVYKWKILKEMLAFEDASFAI